MIKVEADEFKRQFKFIDKEKLFMELQNFKVENNILKEENTKLRTRIQQNEKELVSYERLCENITEQSPNKKNKELLLIQLRKQNKDLQQQLKEKTQQVDHYKKNSKVTKYQELECDRKAYFDETIRMRKLIEESSVQFSNMQIKYNQSLQLESEVQKLLKTNENLQAENKALTQKSQQSDEMMRQLQQLYKVNQQKQQALDKQINDLKNQIKKLTQDKLNLKQLLKKAEEQSYQQNTTNKEIIKPKHTPRPPPLAQHLLDEIRYKLICRDINPDQFADMLEGLKYQAREQNVIVKLDDLKHIFAQEPFVYNDTNKVQQILNSLTGQGNQLVDNLKNLVGIYKTFNNYPSFDFEQQQNKMKQQLKSQQKQIQEYWNKSKHKDIVTKSDVRKMLNSLSLHWDEPQNLYYFLQLFQKSDEDFSHIPIQETYDPFTELQPQQPQQNMRISEESDEELFDKQSQDYSLDENTIKKKKDQGGIIYKDEGEIKHQEEEYYEEDDYNQQQQPQNSETDNQQHQDKEYQEDEYQNEEDQKQQDDQQNEQHQEQEQNEYEQDDNQEYQQEDNQEYEQDNDEDQNSKKNDQQENYNDEAKSQEEAYENEEFD